MEKETAESTKVRMTRRVTYAGMALNVAIAVAKAVGGVMFASRALVADAVHSASDLVTDIAVVFGVRYWVAPADEDHPYGHGKIEALVTTFISAALALVAVELVADAVRTLASGTSREPPGVAALCIALSGVVAKITRNYIDRHMRGKKEKPMYSAFPDVQAEQEALPDSGADA